MTAAISHILIKNYVELELMSLGICKQGNNVHCFIILLIFHFKETQKPCTQKPQNWTQQIMCVYNKYSQRKKIIILHVGVHWMVSRRN